MKRRVKKVLGACFCVLLLVITMAAVCSAAVAAGPLDHDAKCSLRMTYMIPYEGENFPMPGLGIEIFRVADFNGEDVFLTGEFSAYPVAVGIGFDAYTWNTVASTLSAYADADHIQPTAYAYTDDDGIVLFEDLCVGFYLIRWDENTLGDNEIGFDPFILSLPTTDAENCWVYDVDAKPKLGGNLEDLPEEDVPLSDMFGYSVKKLWMDAGHQDMRPESIFIDIYRDGDLFSTVELNDENYWSYSWIDKTQHHWTAVERDVPDTYTVQIEEDERVFVITNCSELPPEDAPKTGVQFEMPVIVYLFGGMGILMMILGIVTQMRGKEKDAE